MRVATASNFSIDNLAVNEVNARQVFIKNTGGSGNFLVRLDAQFNNFNAFWFDYHCKLQQLVFPYVTGPGGPPWADIAGTRRDASWRIGRDNAGNDTTAHGISFSMQAIVSSAPPLGSVDVRLMCWGTVDSSGPFYDYGTGLESAIMTMVPVGAVQ